MPRPFQGKIEPDICRSQVDGPAFLTLDLERELAALARD